MMAYAVHLLANALNQTEAPEAHDFINHKVHMLANAVHPSEVPEVHDLYA